MAQKGRLKAWSQGTALHGPTALAVTERQGSAKLPKRRPQAFAAVRAEADSPTAEEQGPPGLEFGPGFEAAVVERAGRVVELLQRADVKLPADLPAGGQVLGEDNALLFVARYARMLKERGPQAAKPRVAYHWTAEANFQSIAESNLRVPDGAGVKKKHGAAFGRGIYTSPDFRFAREDFSYGASATFMCLVLTGKQEHRYPRSQSSLAALTQGCDSVTGRLPGRPCDTWVFPASDQVLPCFLVDEVALPEALAALRAAAAVLEAPWPAEAGPRAEQLRRRWKAATREEVVGLEASP